MSSFTQLFIHKNCYELFLSAHFNFYLILNLNLTFAVCRIREAYKLSITRISDANNLFFLKKTLFHSTREIRLTMIVSSSTLTLFFLNIIFVHA